MFYLKSYSQFTSNKKLQEMICYTFGENSIKITGETFESTFSTKTIYKVTSTKNWLLVMLNADNFYAISKGNINEDDMFTLKTIFSMNGVKNSIF
ncbi:MAG: YcxB family protein [Flavobacterium sp.]|nr:YcxB family protein [Flavobacterium sp.]